jgi:uncharacterized protein YlaI
MDEEKRIRTFFKSCGGRSQLKTEKRVKSGKKHILRKRKSEKSGGGESLKN